MMILLRSTREGESLLYSVVLLPLVPDTVLSSMFSGLWEGSLKRDSNGRVFLNHDPELIEIIIDFLRMKSIEDPSKPKKNVHVSCKKCI
mmetsp:Transcript_3712/g.4012  ORF Transcript_3712/g.4012 Transcript_3712/m.4012 type:complete len:89 (-) Transcript_3712:192-458(-)